MSVTAPMLPEGPSSSDEWRCTTALLREDDSSICVSPSWCRGASTRKPPAAVTAIACSSTKVALVDDNAETDGHTSPRSVSYVDLTAVDAVSSGEDVQLKPASALEVTLRLLPSIVPAGWALLIAIWAGLAVAVRAEAFGAPTFLAVAFSGWTAVVATALGGLPLLLARPDRVPAKMVGVANAAAAGMMVGAGLGMFGGLVEELPVTGGLAPTAGIAAGAVIVVAVGRLGAPAGNSNRVAMVVVAFAADAFAEGLALAAASVAGSSVRPPNPHARTARSASALLCSALRCSALLALTTTTASTHPLLLLPSTRRSTCSSPPRSSSTTFRRGSP